MSSFNRKRFSLFELPRAIFDFLLRRAQYIKHPSTVPIPREQKKYCVYFSRVHYARNERTNARDAGHASERAHARNCSDIGYACATPRTRTNT